MKHVPAIAPDALADLCHRHGVKKLSLFGSILRDDFQPDRSDVDVLVEFAPGADRGLFTIVRLQDELTALFGRPAHVLTPGSVSHAYRQQILAEAEPLHVAA